MLFFCLGVSSLWVLFQLANFTYLNLQKPILNINFLNILHIINVRFYFILYVVHR